MLTASCSKALLDGEGGGTGTYDLVISGIVSDNTDQTPLEDIRLYLDYRQNLSTALEYIRQALRTDGGNWNGH